MVTPRPSNLNQKITFRSRLAGLHWLLILVTCALCGIGFAMLYSAAGGALDPWAMRQLVRFGVGLGLMLVLALVPIHWLLRYAYLAYAAALIMLVAVEFFGHTGMGAQRWLRLGVINIQPSEVMKLCLILALAAYFHRSSIQDVNRLSHLIVPTLMVALPALLILRQPNLGTASILMMVAAAMYFATGVSYRKFLTVGAAVFIAVPAAWYSGFIKDYQKQRVLTFLNPDADPLGAGYNILQSKIAIGSGGVLGKGYLKGTQSQLSFLPEKQTDFIFTMLAEEFGLIGGLITLGLYILLLGICIGTGLRAHNHFGRMVAIGIATTLFLHIFINIAMVMGLLPVVGVPLPFLSYGGTILITMLIAVGLILNVHVHRDLTLGRGRV